jgi:2-keto-4-pentenoate hydratase/2-oxohepta-3-ene-1,7-dioic acid hydratase in catechol pathway
MLPDFARDPKERRLPPMAFIHFVDEEGTVHWGEDRGGEEAVLLDRDPLAGGRPTGKRATIAKLLPPVVPQNIFGIGRNYREHAVETGAEVPQYPVIFMKPTSAVAGPGEAIRIPACCQRGPEVDYECELVAVIGKAARNVSAQEALSFVFGYTCGNDVSARKWQKHSGGGQWVRGKGFDSFCPLGPRLVTPDELGDPQSLSVSTELNGEVMQQSTTSQMIFPVAELISFLSQDTTLLPGTIILTGTPEGVGFVRNPPVFLSPGDKVTVEVERIGRLINPVVAEDR